MRKSILILLLGVLNAHLLMAVSPTSGSNAIVFSKTEHNFGELAFKDATYAVVFEFKNEGEQPLRIKKCAVTCGCVTPEWSKRPIKKGETGYVRVEFDTKGEPSGFFSKRIFVSTDQSSKITILKIKGKLKD